MIAELKAFNSPIEQSATRTIALLKLMLATEILIWLFIAATQVARIAFLLAALAILEDMPAAGINSAFCCHNLRSLPFFPFFLPTYSTVPTRRHHNPLPNSPGRETAPRRSHQSHLPIRLACHSSYMVSCPSHASFACTGSPIY